MPLNLGPFQGPANREIFDDAYREYCRNMGAESVARERLIHERQRAEDAAKKK